MASRTNSDDLLSNVWCSRVDGRTPLALMAMADLHLNLKGIYFDQIQAGTKLFEYRAKSTWWKRLEGRQFNRVFIKRGYPRAGDVDKIIERPWRGFEVQTITHPHFGPDPIEVCAIRVN